MSRKGVLKRIRAAYGPAAPLLYTPLSEPRASSSPPRELFTHFTSIDLRLIARISSRLRVVRLVAEVRVDGEVLAHLDVPTCKVAVLAATRASLNPVSIGSHRRLSVL